MEIPQLKNVLSIFRGSGDTQTKQHDLFKEVLLMTLARASSADVNIQNVEVDRVREILKEHTGDDFSSADIRVAAREELYAEATLKKYLTRVWRKMRREDRVATVHALADVFRSDRKVSVLEVDFFNGVAEALHVTPAEIAGLSAGDVE